MIGAMHAQNCFKMRDNGFCFLLFCFLFLLFSLGTIDLQGKKKIKHLPVSFGRFFILCLFVNEILTLHSPISVVQATTYTTLDYNIT